MGAGDYSKQVLIFYDYRLCDTRAALAQVKVIASVGTNNSSYVWVACWKQN